jgi:putative NADPH-quinone reductase
MQQNASFQRKDGWTRKMNKAHIVFAHNGSTGFINEVVCSANRTLADKGWSITTTDLALWALAQLGSDAASHAPGTNVELLRVVDCDLLVPVFPMVWASVPATLKQWIEAVFSDQSSYGSLPANSRWSMRGRKAIVVAASEYPKCMQRYDSIETAMSEVLSPVLEGTLNYLGFYVLKPFFINTMEWMQAIDAGGLLGRFNAAFSQIESRACFYGLLQSKPGPVHPSVL